MEFYVTLLGFVNFRLYNSIGLVYPPKFSSKSDEQGGELGAITLEGKAIEAPEQIGPPINDHVNGQVNGATGMNKDMQDKIAAIEELPDAPEEVERVREGGAEDQINDAIDNFETTGDDADILPQPQASSNEAASLFAPFTFFISREAPKKPLEFILRTYFLCSALIFISCRY